MSQWICNPPRMNISICNAQKLSNQYLLTLLSAKLCVVTIFVCYRDKNMRQRYKITLVFL